MVSANALHSKRRHRLPKARFATIQKESEKWLNATFPDLRQEPCYQQGTAGREGEFTRSLETTGMEIYQRGRTVGVLFEGKKYRLKTLGVLDDYETAKDRWKNRKARERDLSEFYRRLEEHPQPEFELPPHINPPLGWD